MAAAVEMIVAIHNRRAPGMELRRIPTVRLGDVVTSLMIVFGFPP